jgi:hypothetical protein
LGYAGVQNFQDIQLSQGAAVNASDDKMLAVKVAALFKYRDGGWC